MLPLIPSHGVAVAQEVELVIRQLEDRLSDPWLLQSAC